MTDADSEATEQGRALWHRTESLDCMSRLITPAKKTIPTVMQSIFVRYKSRLGIIVLAVLLSAMAGCGGPSRDVVGKWHMSQDANPMAWEFSENGSVLIGSTRGRYLLDRDRIKIETPFATSLYQVEFSGDRMILREPKAFKLEFTRIK